MPPSTECSRTEEPEVLPDDEAIDEDIPPTAEVNTAEVAPQEPSSRDTSEAGANSQHDQETSPTLANEPGNSPLQPLLPAPQQFLNTKERMLPVLDALNSKIDKNSRRLKKLGQAAAERLKEYRAKSTSVEQALLEPVNFNPCNPCKVKVGKYPF